MTPPERAEKIISLLDVGSTGPHDWKGDPQASRYSVSRKSLEELSGNIAAQIAEAEREAIVDSVYYNMDRHEQAREIERYAKKYAEGFADARDQAAGIAAAQGCYHNAGACGPIIEKDIRAMLPPVAGEPPK